MPPVAVVTDTTSSLPAELAAEFGIEVIPLHVDYGDGRNALESEVDLGEYYDYLTGAEELPTTTPPTVEEFVALYDSQLAAGRDVVSVHISSGLSQTCAMAREAVKRLGDLARQRVHVIDSATAAGGLGLLALVAARKAAAGADVVDIVSSVREARLEAKLWFSLDTLEFLKRGGRIGGAAAWMGARLQVKPILTLHSEIIAVERVRTRERAFERLVEYGRRNHAAGAEAWGINHTRSEEDARRLTERLREIFWRPPEFVSEIGPVLGTHAGPGMLGMGGIPPRFLE